MLYNILYWGALYRQLMFSLNEIVHSFWDFFFFLDSKELFFFLAGFLMLHSQFEEQYFKMYCIPTLFFKGK